MSKKFIGGWKSDKDAVLAESKSHPPELPSLNLAFDLTKECIDIQLGQVDTLDSKVDSAQVSATTLVGAALVLEVVLLPMNDSIYIRILQLIFIFLLLISYAIVMRNASKAYKIMSYGRVPHPNALIKSYLTVQESRTKLMILNAMGHVFKENQDIIDEKSRLIDKVLKWRMVEAIILVLVLLIQVVSTLFVH